MCNNFSLTKKSSETSQPEVRTITGCFNVACFTFGTTFQLALGNIILCIKKSFSSILIFRPQSNMQRARR